MEDKPKTDDKPTYITLKTADGETLNLQPEEVLQLATYGANKYKEERNKKPEKKVEKTEELDEDEVLKKEVKQLRAEREEDKRAAAQKEEVALINSTLDQLAQSFEETKNNSKLATKIRNLTLTSMNLNPRQNMQKVFKEELDDYMEMIKKPEKVEETKENKAVKRSMLSTIRGGSGPLIDADKKFTAADVKANTSRKEMQKFLEKVISGE